MKELNVKQLPDNFFTAIGKEWMLVTSGDKEHFNTMTASWGCVGWLWNKPVAVIFIRPERYTHEFIEQNETLTLSFLGHEEEMRKAYNICGSRSGRDTDKMALTGLKPIATPSGNVTFEQARLTLECRKLYKITCRPIPSWIPTSPNGMVRGREAITTSTSWKLPTLTERSENRKSRGACFH